MQITVTTVIMMSWNLLNIDNMTLSGNHDLMVVERFARSHVLLIGSPKAS